MNKPVAHEEFDIADIDAALAAEAAEANAAARSKRKKLFVIFALMSLKLGTGWFGYQLAGRLGPDRDRQRLCRRRHRLDHSAGHRPVSPRCWSATRRTCVAGQPLVILDQTDARLAARRGRGGLRPGATPRRGYVATDRQLAAQIAMRGAETSRAAAEVARSAASARSAHRIDYARRARAGRNGAVSGEEVELDPRRLRAGPRRPRWRRAPRRPGRRVTLRGRRPARRQPGDDRRRRRATPIPRSPPPAPGCDQARLDLERTVIRAPVAGIVARAPGPGRPAGPARYRPDERGPGSGRLCRRQLQGRRADQGAPRPAGRAALRSLWRGRGLPRPGRRPRRRHRLGLRADPGPERHRQLDQGGPAPARAHPPRPRRAAPGTRCASACP